MWLWYAGHVLPCVGGTMRPLHEIATDIEQCWGANLSRYARPYVFAMRELDTLEDSYYADNGRGVVCYFLANAGGWRGDDARRIKAELKEMMRHA